MSDELLVMSYELLIRCCQSGGVGGEGSVYFRFVGSALELITYNS